MPRPRAKRSALGIDPGQRRTGFAVTDPLRIACEPLEVYAGELDGEGLCEHVRALLEEREVDTFVLGLPLNMDGSEGERARATRALAARLRERFPGVRIALQDERLSTKAAEDLLRETGLRSWRERRPLRDSMSAVVLLRDWIEAGEPAEETVDPLG